jgi:hypothetical protein
MEQILNGVGRCKQDLAVMPIAVTYDSNDHLETHAPVVAVVGGVFTGAIVAAHLPRKPVHFGAPDAGHLSNLPAWGMSVWPDRPAGLLEWAWKRDSSVGPITFIRRHADGEYGQ